MGLRCDRQVCENLGLVEQTNYLETLKHILSDSCPERSGVSMGCLGHADDKRIQQRFEMIMTGKARTASRITTIVGCLLCAFLFVASYFVIVQPWIPPVSGYNEQENVGPTSLGDSYIICGQDGILRFYYDGLYCFNLFPSDLNTDPFKGLQIIYEGSQKK